MKVNILGTIYDFKYIERNKDPKLEDLDGYTDFTSKRIVVEDMSKTKIDVHTVDDLNKFQKRAARHEIIHAYLHESGLDSSSHKPFAWATNEEMIDWIAIQFSKILNTFKELKIL